jgi:hypothetical protein
MKRTPRIINYPLAPAMVSKMLKRSLVLEDCWTAWGGFQAVSPLMTDRCISRSVPMHLHILSTLKTKLLLGAC